MNVTLTSLEALILKATHESLACPDAAAMEAFCAVMREAADGPQLAAQALAARLHARHPREALLALCMLDRCMRRCDAAFHAEIGKFRFLNEMIKLVSPKYYADRTAPEVRTRVLQVLHAWSIEYPKETKFKVAYDMLKNQGVVKETPPPLPPEDTAPPRYRAKSAVFEDEEKSKLLQKLLQSKKPEDLQHANRLIKSMVREEERRSSAEEASATEVCSARERAGLLSSLLAHAEHASSDETQLIHELHASCTQLRPTLQALAAHAHGDNLSDILHASDVLDLVFEKYKAFVRELHERERTKSMAAPVSNQDSLLDFAGANLGKADVGPSAEAPRNNVIDELGDIFSTDSEANNIAELLKPVTLMPVEDADLLREKSSTAEGWNELNSLGEQLLKQALPDNAKRLDSFNSKPTKKIPMNALEKPSPKHDPPPLLNGATFDLDFFTQKDTAPAGRLPPTPARLPSTDDVMVDISDLAPTNNANNESPVDNILDFGLEVTDTAKSEDIPVANSNIKIETDKKNKCEVKPLTDIEVTLESVQPSKVPPLKAFEEEDGVTVVLHLCKNKPRADVNVIVVSATSSCPDPIEDFQFQAIVPKGCRARLLPARSRSLAGYCPFLPPPALTQLLLLARPPATAVGLKFLLTYTCRGDATTDMGEVKHLPLDDI